MTTLEVYTDILAVIALFVFIVNQIGVFYDRVHIDLVTRRTRKMLANKQRNKKMNIPEDVVVSEPFHMPRINGGVIAGILGGVIVLLLISIAAYIKFFYAP